MAVTNSKSFLGVSLTPKNHTDPSSLATVYQEFAVDDIDELYSWEDSQWAFEYHQLTPGKLQYRSQLVQFPGLRVEWTSYGQRVLFRDALLCSDLVFAIVLEASALPWFEGQHVDRHSGLIYEPEKENEYVLHPGTRTLIVHVSAEIVRQLGWRVVRHSVRPVSSQLTKKLVGACQRLTVAARSAAAIDATDTALDGSLRERVLMALRDVIAPWTEEETPFAKQKAARSYCLVKGAEAVINRLPVGDRLDITKLATELDVSERSIYEAFREWLDMGPYEYHVVRKLHSFRGDLISGPPFHGKITRVAFANGFQHLGRLTQTYRRYFGETPRQTIKRRC